MKNNRSQAIKWTLLLIPLLLAASSASAKDKYACSEPNPEQLCNAKNTCGTATTQCEISVQRTATSAAVKLGIPDAKDNMLFCVHVGTKVIWKSAKKNTGILVDPGPGGPFEPAGAIIGGSDNPKTVVAKKPGCYRYSAGACVSGALRGMCESIEAEFVILP